MFAQGAFLQAPGETTPERIARNRQLLKAMMDNGGARYATEGLFKGLSSVVGGIGMARQNRLEREGQQAWFDGLFGGGDAAMQASYSPASGGYTGGSGGAGGGFSGSRPAPDPNPGFGLSGQFGTDDDPALTFGRGGFEGETQAFMLPAPDGPLQIFADTRANVSPRDGLNISMDFNAAPGGGARGTEVIIPDNATPEVRAAAERYNQLVAAFAEQHGYTDYPIRGVRTRSENGRGVGNTVHTEPFFNDDRQMQEIINANPEAFASIYRDAFGSIDGRLIAPHGVGRDRGAASDVFGTETDFGMRMANALLAQQGQPERLGFGPNVGGDFQMSAPAPTAAPGIDVTASARNPALTDGINWIEVQGPNGPLWVSNDFLRGEDGNYLRGSASLARQMAEQYGARLPQTPDEVDLIAGAATQRVPFYASGEFAGEYPAAGNFDRLTQLHNERLAGYEIGPEDLAAGHFKTVMDNGGIYLDGVQPFGVPHGADYADYSQGIRLVRDTPPDGVARGTGSPMRPTASARNPDVAAVEAESAPVAASAPVPALLPSQPAQAATGGADMLPFTTDPRFPDRRVLRSSGPRQTREFAQQLDEQGTPYEIERMGGGGFFNSLLGNMLGGGRQGEAAPRATASTQGGQPAFTPGNQPSGQPARGSGGGITSMSIDELYAAAMSPWAPSEVRPMLMAEIERRTQAQDPMRQLQLERARLEIEQMRNPQEDPFAGTQVINGQLLTMQDGRPQVLGDFNTPDPGFRMLSPEEATAMGLPEGVPFQIGPDNRVTQVGGGGTTVNVENNMPGQDKFDEAFGSADAAAMATISEAGIAAERNMVRINQLSELLQSSPSGLGAAARLRAGEFGINADGLDDLQAAQALISSLVPEQRQPGSGPMSDADLDLFKQSLPRIINQPGGNEQIIGTMRAIAEYDAEGARIVQAVRAGELTRAQGFEALQNRPNPLADVLGQGPTGRVEEPRAPEARDARRQRFDIPPPPEGYEPDHWQHLWELMTPEERAAFQ